MISDVRILVLSDFPIYGRIIRIPLNIGEVLMEMRSCPIACRHALRVLLLVLKLYSVSIHFNLIPSDLFQASPANCIDLLLAVQMFRPGKNHVFLVHRLFEFL
ncbi:hypothetical protein D5086_003468 [Populus alba]|uniref:Uncharacterized protein n=1 Tax=Populus alba TaxID=43335 RepID=A0ACC4D4X8_POPAL